MVAGGEELPAELARAWHRPGLTLYNGYGPTEATVTSTFTLVTGADVAAAADRRADRELPAPTCWTSS